MNPAADLSPRTKVFLALVQGLLPAMTAICAGIWIVLTYLDQQATAAANRAAVQRLELQKPFLDRQFAVYSELSQLSGKLALSASHLKHFAVDYDHFRSLAASELRMVGDPEVVAAVDAFERVVKDHAVKQDTPSQIKIGDQAKVLGLAFRKSMEQARTSVSSR